MTTSELRTAVKEQLSAYPALSRLYGEALLARCEMTVGQSFLLNALANDNRRLVSYWEDTCHSFLRLVTNPNIAALKIAQEIRGTWKNSSFDSRLKDSFLELRVVCDLSTRGLSQLTAIVAGGMKQPDFSCRVLIGETEVEACLEVKNVRAPVGITEAFRIAFEDAKALDPQLQQYRLSIQHHWDNTVSDEQRDAVASFVGMLKPEEAGVCQNFTLNDQIDGQICIRASLLEGCGDLILSRPEGGSFPVGPHIREDALLKQISEKIEKALDQLASCSDRLKLIALNIDSPTMTMDGAILVEAQQITRQKSEQSAECLIFLNHCYLDC